MTTRREMIAGAAALAASVVPAPAQTSPKAFVLVHGAFHGGWCWRRVADLLEKRGQKVFAPTLTGLGARSHLLDAKVNLTTHITDIVNVIKWERLSDIVLVGHSYGGMVNIGVAERAEPTISSIVFLDAIIPENGQSAIDAYPPLGGGARTALEKQQTAIPPQPAAFFGVNEADRAWIDALCTSQPAATFTEKIIGTGAHERIARKAYVRAVGFPSAPFDGYLAKCRSTPGWRTYEVPSGHDVMIDVPERLTDILLEVA